MFLIPLIAVALVAIIYLLVRNVLLTREIIATKRRERMLPELQELLQGFGAAARELPPAKAMEYSALRELYDNFDTSQFYYRQINKLLSEVKELPSAETAYNVQQLSSFLDYSQAGFDEAERRAKQLAMFLERLSEGFGRRQRGQPEQEQFADFLSQKTEYDRALRHWVDQGKALRRLMRPQLEDSNTRQLIQYTTVVLDLMQRIVALAQLNDELIERTASRIRKRLGK